MSQAQAIPQPESTVEFWNTVLVPKFARYKHILVGGLSLHSARIFPQLEVREGDAAIDVGCGFGDTAIALAERVGPEGRVLGVDCCDGFLAYGRRDAAEAKVDNVSFLEADVLTYPFAPEFDFCFSRFGTQFFDNPVMGLRNMRRSLKPGGTMTMIVWRDIADNPWLGVPKDVVLRFLPPVEEGAVSCGPGPFSMASESLVTRQLQIAGYVDPVFRRIDAPLMIGRDLDDAVAFQIALGPAGEVYREVGPRAEERHDEIVAAIKEAVAPHLRPDGVIMEFELVDGDGAEPGIADGSLQSRSDGRSFERRMAQRAGAAPAEGPELCL